MIFKDLLDVCCVENIVSEIQKQFRKATDDEELLRIQVKQLIEQLQAIKDFFIPDDKLFCFMAVPKNKYNQSIYVGLYDIEEKDISGDWENYRINQVTDWGYIAYQALGITVFEPSLKKYGADCIAAGVLGFILFGD